MLESHCPSCGRRPFQEEIFADEHGWLCPDHRVPLIMDSPGFVRCPEVGCLHRRQTECHAVAGYPLKNYGFGEPILCCKPVEVETWIILPDGSEFFEMGRCRRHPDTTPYLSISYPSPYHLPEGTRIEMRAVARREAFAYNP